MYNTPSFLVFSFMEKLQRAWIRMVLFLTLLCLTSFCRIAFGIKLAGLCPEKPYKYYVLSDIPQCQVLLTVPHHSSPPSQFFRNITRKMGPCYQIVFTRDSIQLFHTHHNNKRNGNASYVHVEFTSSGNIFEGESTVRMSEDHLIFCFKKHQEKVTIWSHENVFILWSCKNINLEYRDEAMIVALNRTKDEKVHLNRVKEIVRKFTGDDLADLINWPNDSDLEQTCDHDDECLKCPAVDRKTLETNYFSLVLMVNSILIGIIVFFTFIRNTCKKYHQENRVFDLPWKGSIL